MGNVIGGDHHFGNRDSEKMQTLGREKTRARCNHAPVSVGDGSHKLKRARHGGHAVVIVGLTALQLSYFGLSIQMRSNGTNHLDGSHAVGDRHHFVAVNSLLAGPDAPLPLNRAGGIDENAVEIEENGGTSERNHSFFFYHSGGLVGCWRQNLWNLWRQRQLMHLLAKLQMPLAEMGLGALAPGADKPIVEPCTEG